MQSIYQPPARNKGAGIFLTASFQAAESTRVLDIPEVKVCRYAEHLKEIEFHVGCSRKELGLLDVLYKGYFHHHRGAASQWIY